MIAVFIIYFAIPSEKGDGQNREQIGVSILKKEAGQCFF